MTSRTILIVDDDDDLRATLVEQLALYEEVIADHFRGIYRLYPISLFSLLVLLLLHSVFLRVSH